MYKALFLNPNTRNSKFFLLAAKKKSFNRVHDGEYMTLLAY